MKTAPMPSSSPKGFSIIEVMFAVMILGVGFILVAAIFPVGIQQTQATADDVFVRSAAISGASQVISEFRSIHPLNRPAVNTGGAYMRMNNLPAALPAVTTPAPPKAAQPLRQIINGLTVSSQDPRYAWTLLYSLNTAVAGNPLDLIMVGLRATNASQCDSYTALSDETVCAWHTNYDNAVIPCVVDTVLVPGSPTRLYIEPGGTNGPQAQQAAIAGAVIVRQAAVGAWRVIHLGNPPDDNPAQWEIAANPSDDPVIAGEIGVPVYLIGRALRANNLAWNVATNPREGACQAVSVRRVGTSLP